jgi:hypothetical protein
LLSTRVYACAWNGLSSYFPLARAWNCSRLGCNPFVARVTGHHSLLTILGAHFYFWGRLGYLLAATAGFSLVRSVLLCWNIAAIGILLFVVALLIEPSTNYA